jgi:hypothetical protein
MLSFAKLLRTMSASTLASATIARLYLQQGHFDKAQAVINALLSLSPSQGEALALRERLVKCQKGSIKARMNRGQIEITWQVLHVDPNSSQHLRIDCFSDGVSSAKSFDHACVEPNGVFTLAAPFSTGACACCLVSRAEGSEASAEPAEILALGRIVQW